MSLIFQRCSFLASISYGKMCCALCLPTSPSVRAWLRPPAELGADWAEPRRAEDAAATPQSQLPEPSAGWHWGRARWVPRLSPRVPTTPMPHPSSTRRGCFIPARCGFVPLQLCRPPFGAGKAADSGVPALLEPHPSKPRPPTPTPRRAAREGPGGGGSGSRPPTRLQEPAPTRCPVTPGGHRQLLGPRWPQAGQDGALSPLAPYLAAAAGARGQGGGCGGSGRARAGARRKEPRGQPLPPAHGARAKQPCAKANSSPDNCHY